MKRGYCLIAVAASVALGLSSCEGIAEAQRKAEGIKSISIAELDFSKVADGIYEAYADYGLDTARVAVRVEGGKVLDIEIKEHRHGPGEKRSGAPVARRVIEAQSLRVDAVSGATGSSKVMLKAIETALAQGLRP
ncbi:MAG TPA: FMN-binding protein [Spirochaetales bacterium]|nr:FMN-binding protein [Spirochaetales bacterium]HRY54067.1 FMN-binding protein [Spirochaetia bacterium]